jgi:hypothetical protein
MSHRISPIAKPGSLLKADRPLRARRPKRERASGHLAAVRLLPCVACGADPSGQAAHLRMGGGGAMGLKPGDHLVTPLCFACHERQHRIGEVRFWGTISINPHKVATRLFLASPDIDVMRGIIHAEREGRK